MKGFTVAAVVMAVGASLIAHMACADQITYYFDNDTGEPVSLIFTINSKKGIYSRTVALAHGRSHIAIEGCLTELRTQAPADLVKEGADIKTRFQLNSRYNCTQVQSTIVKLQNGAYDIRFNYL